jgi:hypothetical protein
MHIPGAEEANQKVADMIETHMESISDIFVTLRSRRVPFAILIMLLVCRNLGFAPLLQEHHISHPCFWKDAAGKRPAPGTVITIEDLNSKVYVPASDKELVRLLFAECLCCKITVLRGRLGVHNTWSTWK